MGLCHCGTSNSTKGFEVSIDHQVDFIDKATHRQQVADLDRNAVHGHISGISIDHDVEDGNSTFCGTAVGIVGDKAALEIVQNAKRMAAVVSSEDDILDGEWHGVNNEDALMMLLGTLGTTATTDTLLMLATSLKDLVASESSLNECAVPAKVFGDLHGQFRDMLLFLHHYGFPSIRGPHFVFNGDWVDRGKHQLETIALVYALKLAFPDRVWLNRGNHEDSVQNAHQGKAGFNHVCTEKLGDYNGKRVFEAFGESFNYLPIGCVIGESIFVVHGGIGDGQWDLQRLVEVQRPVNHQSLAKDVVLYNALWSDPIDEDKPDCFGVHDSPRDNHSHLMKTFGTDISEAFCRRNEVQMIIRSHEAKVRGDGYEVMHDERLVRVFSARDYGNGKMKNDGSVLHIYRQKNRLIVTPQVLKSLTKT